MVSDPVRPKHREVSPFLIRSLRLGELVATLALAQDNAFGQPLESQLRSCLLATWMCEQAGLRRRRARHRLLGGAAALPRLHRTRPRGGHRVRRRDRHPRPDAGARRRQSGRGDARRDGLRNGGSHPGRTRPDRQDDPGDRPRVGGLQLLLGLRGGRHAGAAARLRPGRARVAAIHVRALERQRLPQPRQGRGDSAADADRAPEPRHGGDRPPVLARPTRSRPPATAATAPTTRRWPTCSSRTGAAGSTGWARPSHGTPCSRSNPQPHRVLAGR